jgi:hypothetical protein
MVTLIPSPFTHPAYALSESRNTGIFWRERMPLYAMRSCSPKGLKCVPSQQIFPARHGLQMSWSHTTWVFAEMVKLEPLGYRSPFEDKGDPVCLAITIPAVTFLAVPRPAPQPTTLAAPDVRPEPVLVDLFTLN